jgi:hypothetical protein
MCAPEEAGVVSERKGITKAQPFDVAQGREPVELGIGRRAQG